MEQGVGDVVGSPVRLSSGSVRRGTLLRGDSGGFVVRNRKEARGVSTEELWLNSSVPCINRHP